MEKTYFNSLKGEKTKYGVRIFGKVDDVINEIMKHEKHGWIDLEMKERREPDKHNCTHYLTVNIYQKDVNRRIDQSMTLTSKTYR